MKIIYLIYCILFSTVISAQEQDNRFRADEDNTSMQDDEHQYQKAADTGPPGDDDLPIDDYIPVLVITAVGMILYTTQKKKKISIKINNRKFIK